MLEIGYEIAGDRIEEAIYAPSKVERQKKVGALRDEVEAAIKERHPEATDFDVEQVFEYIQKKAPSWKRTSGPMAGLSSSCAL